MTGDRIDDATTVPARIVVADDDQIVRAGIAAILSSDDDIEIVAHAANGSEAIGAVDAHRPDVVLLDIQMPHLNGIDALREIRRRRPDLPVAMLTTFSDDHLISDAIGSGALGFLLKSDEPQQLISGVRALACGGGAFSPRVARWLASREQAGHRAETSRRDLARTLSSRQLEVLTHIGGGLSNAQIAASVHLSEGTVKQYVSQLFDEFGIDNRVQAAIIAFRNGLID